MELVNTANSGANAPAGRGIPEKDSVVQLYVRLNTARKLGEFFSSDHPCFLEAVEGAAEIINGFGEYAGELSYSSNDGSISSGGTRFKPEEPYLDDFAAALRTANITVIRLARGVAAAGLASFTSLLAACTDLDVGTGKIRQLISGLVADGIRVGMTPAGGPAVESVPLGQSVEEAVWKTEVQRLFGVIPACKSAPGAGTETGENVVLANINPRRLAGLINTFDSVVTADTVYEKFLMPYLRQVADGESGSEGLIPDHVQLRFIQFLRALSPGHQVRFTTAVLETSHSFTPFATGVLEAIPVQLAGKALARIKTEENTVHPRITSRFEALCRLTGWNPSADDQSPQAPGEVDIDVNTVDGVVRCTPRFEKAAAGTAPPVRRISFAAEFTPAGKRKALIRVGLDLLERSTTLEEARVQSRVLPQLFTEALNERDWIGLNRDWIDLVALVKKGQASRPFLTKTLRRIRESFITAQTMERIVIGIENCSAETGELFKQWLPALGPAAGDAMIKALIESNNRSRRRHLLSAIVCFGQDAVPLALKRISDPRWYVVRNMITIIREVGDKRAAEDLLTLTNHAQFQVRRELINTLLALDHPEGLELAESCIRSGDRKLRSASIGLLGSHRVDGARNILLQVLKDQESRGVPYSQPQKVSAIWALGQIGNRAVLPELQQFLKKSRMFKSPDKHELKMAILRSLPGYQLKDVEALARWGMANGDEDEAASCSMLVSNILLLTGAGK